MTLRITKRIFFLIKQNLHLLVVDKLKELFIYIGIVGVGEKSVDIGRIKGIYIIRPSGNIVLIENVVGTSECQKIEKDFFLVLYLTNDLTSVCIFLSL
jgi:hypothetical protein